MALKNPYFVPLIDAAKDPDQRRACYRYIASQLKVKGAASGLMLQFNAYIEKTLLPHAKNITTDRSTILKKSGDSLDYTLEQPTAPGLTSLAGVAGGMHAESVVLHQLLITECTRYGLNPTIMKGCLKGYAITVNENYSPIFASLLDQYLRYRGRAIFNELSNTHSVINTNFHSVRVGGSKRKRGNGFKRRRRGRRRY